MLSRLRLLLGYLRVYGSFNYSEVAFRGGQKRKDCMSFTCPYSECTVSRSGNSRLITTLMFLHTGKCVDFIWRFFFNHSGELAFIFPCFKISLIHLLLLKRMERFSTESLYHRIFLNFGTENVMFLGTCEHCCSVFHGVACALSSFITFRGYTWNEKKILFSEKLCVTNVTNAGETKSSVYKATLMRSRHWVLLGGRSLLNSSASRPSKLLDGWKTPKILSFPP